MNRVSLAGIFIIMFALLPTWVYAQAQVDGQNFQTLEKQVLQVHQQSQNQNAQLQANLQKEIASLNSQLQLQIKQVQTQLQEQIQQLQQQINKLGTKEAHATQPKNNM